MKDRQMNAARLLSPDLSAHETLAALAKVRSGEPDNIVVHSTSVVLTYGKLDVVVSRRKWDLLTPEPGRLFDALKSGGVSERARAAVECGEGEWTITPGPDLDIAFEKFGRRLWR
jgi:hypothetical protein